MLTHLTPARTLLLCATLLLLSGCSLRYDRNGKMQFNPDFASVLGNEVGHFTLADGSTGVLRELNGKYSLKFGTFFIERPIEGVSWAEISQQFHVDGHTLLLLKVATRACPSQYRLVDLQQTRSSEWDFKQACDIAPHITQNASQLLIDFQQRQQVQRFKWQHGEVYRSQFTAARPAPAASTRSAPPARSRTATRKASSHRPSAAPVSVPPAVKVTPPTLNDAIPDELYDPTKTRQTSLGGQP